MILKTALLITILFTSTTGLSIDGNHVRRLLFGTDKGSANSDESSSGHGFSNWLDGFLSGDSNKEKQSDSFSKLALLKQLLSSSSSSSSSDKNGKLNTLFQMLSQSATDEKNESSSSSSKLNRLLGFFNNQGSSSSSNNLQLAMKLLSLAQGNGGLSSFSGTDIKSLLKYVG